MSKLPTFIFQGVGKGRPRPILHVLLGRSPIQRRRYMSLLTRHTVLAFVVATTAFFEGRSTKHFEAIAHYQMKVGS